MVGTKYIRVARRDTEIVFEEYISSAQESIILSIYSLSEYASSLINLLEKKSNKESM